MKKAAVYNSTLDYKIDLPLVYCINQREVLVNFKLSFLAKKEYSNDARASTGTEAGTASIVKLARLHHCHPLTSPQSDVRVRWGKQIR